ncbi:MAG: ATP-binding cassette domain-containing protein [bacterium]|nr:ATP-binding cassette domain-containing protein [bacterium]
MLELKNIIKRYQTGEFVQTALNGVSIKFRHNEFVAILGPSGSGKTTCLNVIGGLDQYDEGDVIINGTSTRTFSSSDWDAYRNNSIGFIFQSYNLIPHLDLIDNVTMGMTLSGVSIKEKKQRAIDVLKKVGLKKHIHKLPNQLSGGQMQRVAIARALANDPDIILADEPTGALDTSTSIQIMNLIREIAKDKLVIMVTHNPELAHEYADRIIEFKDGEVEHDSNPPEENETVSDYKLKKTSMNFLTALKLSGKNISTKKWRTILTAFGSSIGIIGIALILSLSNGFSKQIKDYESNTLSGYPILINNGENMLVQHSKEHHLDEDSSNLSSYPDTNYIIPYDESKETTEHSNVLTDDYIRYIESIDPSLVSAVDYTRTASINLLAKKGDKVNTVNSTSINFTSYPKSIDNKGTSYLSENYDLLSGSYPTSKNDLVLVVDKENKVDVSILNALLGEYNESQVSFSDLINMELKAIPNNDYYKKTDTIFTIDASQKHLDTMYQLKNAIPLKIVGILRGKEGKEFTILNPGIAYSDDLTTSMIENAKSSDIVAAQKAVSYNVLTGLPFEQASSTNASTTNGSVNSVLTKDTMLSMLGASGTPSIVKVFPTDFDAKEDVLNYLDGYNTNKPEKEQIIYTDLAATLVEMTSSIMDAITMVLVAFASISLVVSLIMISIITYISVLERTKEIGVLRALGARKKDISRVFNAETFIIGTCSGCLGIMIAFLLTFPINAVIDHLVSLKNVATLSPLHAILLITVSVSLTVLGGLIPARMAAKKDPVEALRA